MLVGIIAGPHEPKVDINSYLTPLVLELQEFYKGVSLQCTMKDGKCICDCMNGSDKCRVITEKFVASLLLMHCMVVIKA